MPDHPQHPSSDQPADPSSLSVELLDAAVELMGRTGRSGRVRVRGSSMLPTLRPGDELAVRFTGEPPSFGELIVFRQHGVLVVHRCLGRARRGGWRSRGDGVPGFDPAVAPERLLGRVVAAAIGGRWRAFDAGWSTGWARAVALHDLWWGAAAVAVGPLDRLLGGPRGRRPLRRLVGAADHHLLALAHRLTFGRCHPTLEQAPD